MQEVFALWVLKNDRTIVVCYQRRISLPSKTISVKIDNVTNYLGAFLRKDNELYDAFCAAFEQFDRDIHKDEPWNIQIIE